MKYIAIIILFVLSTISCQGTDAMKQEEIIKEELIGKSVGDAIAYFNVSFDSVTFNDEPPGKLKCVSFSAPIEGKKQKVSLWLEYDATLFSAQRKWNPDIVKKANIRSIEIM